LSSYWARGKRRGFSTRDKAQKESTPFFEKERKRKEGKRKAKEKTELNLTVALTMSLYILSIVAPLKNTLVK